MKKIVFNHLYDTDTAEEIGACQTTEDEDICFCKLYRKKNKQYFLYEKNCMPLFGGDLLHEDLTNTDGCSFPGFEEIKIFPITEEKAKIWAEKHMSGEDYIRNFGEVEE